MGLIFGILMTVAVQLGLFVTYVYVLRWHRRADGSTRQIRRAVDETLLYFGLGILGFVIHVMSLLVVIPLLSRPSGILFYGIFQIDESVVYLTLFFVLGVVSCGFAIVRTGYLVRKFGHPKGR